MSQERYPDWYMIFMKWQFRATLFVMVPLQMVGFIVMVWDSGDTPRSITHAWHPLLHWLGLGCFLVGFVTFLALASIGIRMNKKAIHSQ